MESLVNASSGKNQEELFYELFDQLTSFAAQKNDKSNHLIQRVAQLTETLYANNQLGIAMLAEKLNLNASYLSAQYKKITGENLLVYINQVRISHAKELLRDPKLTMMQIAQAVGYRSDVNLIRVFKKYEGITPGVYRKTLSCLSH